MDLFIGIFFSMISFHAILLWASWPHFSLVQYGPGAAPSAGRLRHFAFALPIQNIAHFSNRQ